MEQINYLTDQAIPPTPQIVRNLAQEITKTCVGKDWVAAFIKRHQNRLKSVYLQLIDQKCVKSEYPPAYEHFYELVVCFWLHFELN